MNLHPDPLKQAQEVVFSWKRNKPHHPDIIFNGNMVKNALTKNFWECFSIVNSILMNILKEYLIKLVNLLVLFASSKIFTETSFLEIYKYFVRPHLDYGDIIYDKAFIHSFQKKLESIQYNAVLAITEAIRGISRKKIYPELGVESL